MRTGQTWCPPGGTSCSHTPLPNLIYCNAPCTSRLRPAARLYHLTHTDSNTSVLRSRQSQAALSQPHTTAAPTATQPANDDDKSNTEEEPLVTRSSVFRITVVKDLPRFDMPLLLGSVQSLTRTATAVTHKGQDYLLTNASSVLYAQEIKVHVDGLDTPYQATVAHLCMEADLAVLEVKAPRRPAPRPGAGRRPPRARAPAVDAGAEEGEGELQPIWEAARPMELRSLPTLLEHVQVPGGSSGPGQSPGSSAMGQVACIEVLSYPLASFRLLGLSVTATIPKERLGAPVVDRQGRCVGITFQRVQGGSGKRRRAGQRGRRGGGKDRVHACPASVVAHVLDDIQEHGHCMGFAQLGIRYKLCDAAGLRSYLGMAPRDQGIMVLDVNPSSTVAGLLRPGDVIMKHDGEQVGNDGTMQFELGGRLSITHRVAQMHVGSTATITIMRQGQCMDLKVMLGVPHRLLPSHLSGRPPSYLVVGGLVLTRLSVPYLEQAFGANWLSEAPPKIGTVAGTHPSDSEEEVVVVAHCEDVKGLQGYKPELLEQQRVVAFRLGPQAGGPGRQEGGTGQAGDGVAGIESESGHCGGGAADMQMQRVRTLRQLAAAVLACKEGEIRLELGDGSVVVLGAVQAGVDARALLAEYEVERVVSADLADLLPQTRSAPRLSLGGAGRGR